MSQDHNIFYLLDKENNDYHYYSLKYHFKKGRHEFCLGAGYNEFDKALKRKQGMCDLIVDDGGFKIYVLTKDGLKRNDRQMVKNSIDNMIECGEFTYYEI